MTDGPRVRIYVMKSGENDVNGEVTQDGLRRFEAAVRSCFHKDRVPIHVICSGDTPTAVSCAELVAWMVDRPRDKIIKTALANDDDPEAFLRYMVNVARYTIRKFGVNEPVINVVIVTNAPSVMFGEESMVYDLTPADVAWGELLLKGFPHFEWDSQSHHLSCSTG